MRQDERQIVRGDKERVINDGDERSAVNDRVVGRLGVDGSVGLDGVAGAIGDVEKRGVGHVELLSPHNVKRSRRVRERCNVGSDSSNVSSVLRRSNGLSRSLPLKVDLSSRG